MATPIKMYKVTEEESNSIDVKDGQLIFTTDTNKIYLDANDQRDCYTRQNIKTYVQDGQPNDATNGDIWLMTEEGGSSGPVKPSVKIVTFADGTDEEIAAMLEAHYNNKINIKDYWTVGDTRVVHIRSTNSGTVSHTAQDMTMVIMDFDHDDLTTPINGKTKAAVTIGFREAMGDYQNADYEKEYYLLKETWNVPNTTNYSTTSLRNWLNNGLLNVMPETFSSLIKEVNKKNLKYHDSTSEAPLITQDKIWLPSYPEVYGTKTYMYYLNEDNITENVEGFQYTYFETSSNRIKWINGGYSQDLTRTCDWWLRSPFSKNYSNFGYFFGVSSYYSGEPQDAAGTQEYSLAPAFCL